MGSPHTVSDRQNLVRLDPVSFQSLMADLGKSPDRDAAVRQCSHGTHIRTVGLGCHKFSQRKGKSCASTITDSPSTDNLFKQSRPSFCQPSMHRRRIHSRPFLIQPVHSSILRFDLPTPNAGIISKTGTIVLRSCERALKQTPPSQTQTQRTGTSSKTASAPLHGSTRSSQCCLLGTRCWPSSPP